MCEVFGGKQSILPSALLGFFGGLKRKVKMEHDNEEEDAAVRKKVKFQKAKAPPMVQMLREINEEKKSEKSKIRRIQCSYRHPKGMFFHACRGH